MKFRFPRYVPVLAAGDMANFFGNENRACLMGWVRNVFIRVYKGTPLCTDKRLRDVYEAIRKAGQEVSERYRASGCSGITTLNDTYCESNAERARVWNLAMVFLGYTEGNPETERAKE